MKEELILKSFQIKIEKLFTLVEVIEAEYQLLLEEYNKLKMAQHTNLDKAHLQ